MIPGLKVENDKIVLDVPQILLYKPLAAIYQADYLAEQAILNPTATTGYKTSMSRSDEI